MKITAYQYRNPHPDSTIYLPVHLHAVRTSKNDKHSRLDLLLTMEVGPMSKLYAREEIYAFISGSPEATGLFDSFMNSFRREGETSPDSVKFLGGLTSVRLTPKKFGDTLFSTVNFSDVPVPIKNQLRIYEKLNEEGRLMEVFADGSLDEMDID